MMDKQMDGRWTYGHSVSISAQLWWGPQVRGAKIVYSALFLRKDETFSSCNFPAGHLQGATLHIGKQHQSASAKTETLFISGRRISQKKSCFIYNYKKSKPLAAHICVKYVKPKYIYIVM